MVGWTEEGQVCTLPEVRDDTPTADEIRDLLATLLAGAAGGTEAEWTALVGPVTVHPIWLKAACNWRVEPNGTTDQIEAIEKAVAVVAEAHPYARKIA